MRMVDRNALARFAVAAGAPIVLALVLGISGCAEATVKVETGTRTVCTYGEVVSSDVRVVEVPASQAAKYRIVKKRLLCSAHRRAELVYKEAQDALRRGDLAEARESLAEVLRLTPGFRNAAKQAAELDAGKKPAPDGAGSDPAPSTGTTGTVDGPVASLLTFVPDSIPGYTARPVTADPNGLTREYAPAGAATGYLVVAAEQFATPAAAIAALAKGPKNDYSVGASTLTVEGRSVYFGTDGSRFAVVAWTEGAIMVIAEASPKSGPPSGLQSPLTDVAGAIIK